MAEARAIKDGGFAAIQASLQHIMVE